MTGTRRYFYDLPLREQTQNPMPSMPAVIRAVQATGQAVFAEVVTFEGQWYPVLRFYTLDPTGVGQ